MEKELADFEKHEDRYKNTIEERENEVTLFSRLVALR